ncbi:hypothetical protein HY312_04345 [Candidatus Saccharibacteria bacterium]|nr:hypothetical protein [Candidatus Saccharibacteria bacterium]
MKTFMLPSGIHKTLSERLLIVAQYSVAVIAIAGVGNLLISHTASATFFAARGEALVSGMDRSTGQQKNLTKVIYSYPGDVVQFRSSVWNGGDIGYTTDVIIKNRYFDGTDSTGTTLKPHALTVKNVRYTDRLWEEPLIILGASLIYQFGYGQSVQHWNTPAVTLSGPGSDVPGNRFCQYPTVSVGGYNIIPWPGAYPGIPFIPYGPVSFKNNMACAEIAYNYNLMPTITLNNGGEVRVGKVPEVTPKVNQGPLAGGNPTYTKDTQWQITKVVLKADGTKPNPDGGISNQVPCNGNAAAYFKPRAGGNTGIACEIVAQSGTRNATKNTIFNADGTFRSGSSLPASLPPVTGLQDDQIVCYALSVNTYAPYISTAVVWRHSPLVCNSSAVSKLPKVQVQGNDVRVGGKIATSLSVATVASTAKIFGSWGEYASLSAGASTGFATASGLAGGVAEGSPQASWSKLTFANTLGTFGSFASASSFTNTKKIGEYLNRNTQGVPGSQVSIDLAALTGSNKPYVISNGATPVEIRGGTIPKGKTVIIIATGKVILKNDIRYTTDSLASIKDIPQVVIIAKDISIAEEVKNVDAWLIANATDGTIDTCAPRQASDRNLTVNVCKDQLQVNGPVLTGKLLLNRTAGSDSSDPGAPAEVFNGRADAYLWAMQYDSNGRRALTTHQIELPPKF